jgi:hypothetical protein
MFDKRGGAAYQAAQISLPDRWSEQPGDHPITWP